MTDPAPLCVVDGTPSASIPVDDRGFAYGDGVFETVRVLDGEPILLNAHLERLATGLERLSIDTVETLAGIRHDLTTMTPSLPPDAVIKITVTRGSGGRGYAPPRDSIARRIVSATAYRPDGRSWQEGISVSVSDFPLAVSPTLAGIKHLARLEQVIAAARMPEGDDEAILLDTDGRVVEGTKSNLFVVTGTELSTPPLDRCGVAGVMRRWIFESMDVSVTPLSLDDVTAADEVFFCNSVFGLFPVRQMNLGHDVRRFEAWPRARGLQRQLVDELGFRSG